jgi:DNA-binding protein YbaB
VTDLPLGATADGAEEWVRSWTASMSERAAAAQAMSDQVARLTVSAADEDGLVTVTVSGSGAVTGLRLDERVHRWTTDRLGDQILATMRRAQATLAGRVAEIAADTVGADSETGRAVVASFETRFPAEPPDDQRRPDAGGGSSRGR